MKGAAHRDGGAHRLQHTAALAWPRQWTAQRAGRKQGGFTIVETMVVLAVTSGIFLAAVALVAGRTAKAQFTQAVADIQSDMQQKINQVSTGYYANTNNFTCSAAPDGPRLVAQANANKQGANNGCIFLGRAVQFAVGSTDPQAYTTYTLAGLQANDGDLAKAKPVAIAPASGVFPVPPDASVRDLLHNGLRVVSMTYSTSAGGPPVNIGAIAFVSTLGTLDSANSGYMSGSQQMNLVPVPGTSLGSDQLAIADAIKANLASAPQNPAGGVHICFQSGSTSQSALMTLGSNGRSLNVKVDIKSSENCS